MSYHVTSRSLPGSLRQEVVFADGHQLVTDEPPSVGGDGSAPTPHELLPAAVASCISTTLVMYARRKEWDLREAEVDVVFDPKATPRTFEIEVRVDGDLDDEQRERLEQIAAACPVRRSLEATSTFQERLLASDSVPAAG